MYSIIGFTICKFCSNPIKWVTKNDKWYPTALDGNKHICRKYNVAPHKTPSTPKLSPHEKLNRTPIHAENEDQVARILEDRPLV